MVEVYPPDGLEVEFARVTGKAQSVITLKSEDRSFYKPGCHSLGVKAESGLRIDHG